MLMHDSGAQRRMRFRSARTLVFFAFILVVLARSSGNALGDDLQPLFGLTNSVGVQPLAIKVGDFDGNGIQDIVVVNYGSDDISVLLGAGKGLFKRQVRYALERQSHPTDVAVGDVDSDGDQDLFVLGDDGYGWLLRGRGDGTFCPRETVPVGGPYTHGLVFLEDLNANGQKDLVVLEHGAGGCGRGAIVTSLGMGDGSFAVPFRLDFSGHPRDAIVGDFDFDGKLDFAVALASERNRSCYPSAGGLLLLKGHGDGTFEKQHELASESAFGPCGIASGDFNEDGRHDFALRDAGSITLYYGDSSGRPALHSQFGSEPLLSCALQAADFDADGHVDLATSRNIFLGHGDGVFADPFPLRGPTFPSVWALGDFDNNGIADLAGVTRESSELSLVMGLSTLGATPHSFAVADFNRDGISDLAVSTLEPNSISILLGRGNSSFRLERRYAVGPYTWELTTGDLNNDENADVVGVSRGTGEISIMLGLGNGGFAPEIRYGAGINAFASGIGDFNGDGNLDVAITAISPSAVYIYFGRGDGTLSLGGYQPHTSPNPSAMLVADFNEDGLDDFALGGTNYYEDVSVFLGIGNGSFSPPRQIRSGLDPFRMAAGDFNNDGILDIATANHGSQDISVLIGKGGGDFSPLPPVQIDGRPTSVVVADFNRDGNADLGTSDNFDFSLPPEVSVFLGQGDGSFTGRQIFRTEAVGTFMASGDFNLDGLADLAIAQDRPNGITVLTNQWRPPNQPPTAVATSEYAVECTSPAGALVNFDASASSDPDSTPGTNDDIISFEWLLGGCGQPLEGELGTGEKVSLLVPVGFHTITLRVVDRLGEVGTSNVGVWVTDSTPPELTVRLSRSFLWPPNHQMVNVVATVVVEDTCSCSWVSLESIVSSEPDDAPGSGDGHTVGDIAEASLETPDLNFRLRAERSASNAGRRYIVTYRAMDESWNATWSSATIIVPLYIGD